MLAIAQASKPSQQASKPQPSEIEIKMITFVQETLKLLMDIGCIEKPVRKPAIELFKLSDKLSEDTTKNPTKIDQLYSKLVEFIVAFKSVLDSAASSSKSDANTLKDIKESKNLDNAINIYMQLVSQVKDILIGSLNCIKEKERASKKAQQQNDENIEKIKEKLRTLKEMLSISLKIYQNVLIKYFDNIKAINKEIDKILDSKKTCVVM